MLTIYRFNLRKQAADGIKHGNIAKTLGEC
jgi:hypothetical protein